MPKYRASFDGELRTAFAGCQLTPSERAELDRRAAKARLPLSEFMRQSCLGSPLAAGARASPAPLNRPMIDDGIALLIASELAAIGNNVNQTARRLNAANDASICELAAGAVAHIEAIAASLKEIIGRVPR